MLYLESAVLGFDAPIIIQWKQNNLPYTSKQETW